ncbi:MAG TPA: RNA methyltransferase, partial [Gammaproteobacteria bacterium]|nr:RNA methyltransferase [Gammaproteobacteria bacterium]
MKLLLEALRAAGARPRHETLALRAWCRGLPLDAFAKREDSAFPKRLQAELPALQNLFDSLVTVCAEHPGADGSARLLLALGDGQTIESVHLPGDGVCVSTQVGCAVGCTFCMTGRDGLRRQLRSAEIVAQVALARARRRVALNGSAAARASDLPPIRRVVLMGMGEPAHNLDNVLEALDLLGREGDLNSKNLVLSTVGDRRVFERLPHERVKPALALSLHTTKPDLRTQLLPRAPRIEPAELVALADEYSRATKYPTQYQWTLLEGVNDGDDELEGIARLLAGKYAVMNFIPYNTVDGTDYRRPSWRRAAEMTRYLYDRGVLAKVRRSAGQDVEAGCGQLRRRHATRPSPPPV